MNIKYLLVSKNKRLSKTLLIILYYCLSNYFAFSQEKLYKLTNPFHLDYDYYEVKEAEDGTSVSCYIERGKKQNNGNYAWSKAVPLDSSTSFSVIYEYQLDFTSQDFNILYDFLKNIMGEMVKMTSIDNPSWYKSGMLLKDVFDYCKMHKTNIKIIMLNEKKYCAIIDFDASSNYSRPEIGLVLSILK